MVKDHAAIDATADQTVLAHDEFCLVDHGRDHYTLVLPGVTDLSRPEQGWNRTHRSARDFDMAAVPSARSLGVGHNVYAQSVAAALAESGVPDGAKLVIIGHSFGADTALDLAADPEFAGRYRVGHVVATGYFSQPQLGSVAPETRVLVVQNRHDLVVRLGSGMPVTGIGVLDCDPAGAANEPGPSIVRFDGGINGLGHSIDEYKSVFTGEAELSPGDAAIIREFLAVEPWASDPPASMLAIDISLSEP